MWIILIQIKNIWEEDCKIQDKRRKVGSKNKSKRQNFWPKKNFNSLQKV